mmetsp:Transcript_16678/g.36356  ORF Transcript_16678/g.36356 Transcript_16678/m.36356 type:complete len:105 (+) Transcript_16678:1271-1585(+)
MEFNRIQFNPINVRTNDRINDSNQASTNLRMNESTNQFTNKRGFEERYGNKQMRLTINRHHHGPSPNLVDETDAEQRRCIIGLYNTMAYLFTAICVRRVQRTMI